MKRAKAYALLCILLAASACTKTHTITVYNDSAFDRDGEMVEIDTAVIAEFGTGESFRIVNADKEEVPYQLTHDGKVIFPATVAAQSTATYSIVPGAPAAIDTVVYGRIVPERKDDMAWENDRCAYRAYGPALEESGERAFGYDIWTKSVPYPILNQRYYDDIVNKISFHVDHGNGMDAYAVGPTLGGGTAALLNEQGEIVYPYCFREYEVLDEGPLRFTVTLTYGGETVDGDSAVVETRTISLDRGSFLNKTIVQYNGLSADKTVAPGIVVHAQNPEGYVFAPESGYMTYADLTENAENDNGTIFVGIVSPQSTAFEYKAHPEAVGDAIGHILAPAAYSEGEDFTYWWGAGWSKGGMPDQESWNEYLSAFAKNLNSPLKVEVK